MPSEAHRLVLDDTVLLDVDQLGILTAHMHPASASMPFDLCYLAEKRQRE